MEQATIAEPDTFWTIAMTNAGDGRDLYSE